MAGMYGKRAFTEEERETLIEQIVRLHGMNHRRLARKLGVSESTIGRYTLIARERGLLPPSTKIKPPEVRAALVADLAVPGWSPTELARRHGYTKAGIYHQAVKHGYYVRGVGQTQP